MVTTMDFLNILRSKIMPVDHTRDRYRMVIQTACAWHERVLDGLLGRNFHYEVCCDDYDDPFARMNVKQGYRGRSRWGGKERYGDPHNTPFCADGVNPCHFRHSIKTVV